MADPNPDNPSVAVVASEKPLTTETSGEFPLSPPATPAENESPATENPPAKAGLGEKLRRATARLIKSGGKVFRQAGSPALRQPGWPTLQFSNSFRKTTFATQLAKLQSIREGIDELLLRVESSSP